MAGADSLAKVAGGFARNGEPCIGLCGCGMVLAPPDGDALRSEICRSVIRVS